MIKIKFPDDSVRKYKKGITAIEIAMDISEGFSRNVLSASFNENTIEKKRRINSNTYNYFYYNT